jgi:NADH-quinone oxidoreductase subunit J
MYDFISGLFFYVFAFTTLLSAIMVVSVRNPVHSVLFLIMAFFSTSGLFILIGAEFIAMTLIIVYVGAVAVLFLFVVMMMNINVEKIKFGLNKNLPVFIGLSLILLIDLLFIIISSIEHLSIREIGNLDKKITNTHEIGQILYTDYIYHFEIAGLILLVAMIGAIVLTLRDKKTSHKQNKSKQLARNRENSMRIVKVPTGVGIDGIID